MNINKRVYRGNGARPNGTGKDRIMLGQNQQSRTRFAGLVNENLTAAEMGNSPAVVFKRYRALVKPEEVEAYWNILPPAV